MRDPVWTTWIGGGGVVVRCVRAPLTGAITLVKMVGLPPSRAMGDRERSKPNRRTVASLLRSGPYLGPYFSVTP